jgi:hypothetical protein
MERRSLHLNFVQVVLLHRFVFPLMPSLLDSSTYVTGQCVAAERRQTILIFMFHAVILLYAMQNSAFLTFL